MQEKSSRSRAVYYAKFTTVIAVLAVVAIFLIFSRYRLEIKEMATYAVSTYGFPALFLITWASDVIIQPIPADVFVFGSTFGGAKIFETAFVAGLSSGMGGMTGYYIGRWFGPWRFKRVFGTHLLQAGKDLFKNYGWMAVFISGITPIPYSAVCWVGGIYQMPVVHVFLASWVSRTIRYVIVGWLGTLA